MPRKPSPMPGYKFHTSGQARVFLNRKAYYLGEYDSPESYARYHNLLAIYNANGQKMPDDVPTHQIDLPLTIGCLTAEFRENLKSRYANNKHERRRFSNLCTLLEDEYGDLPLDAFGPIKLADVRDLFVASGNCRNYVNQQTRNIVRIFKFGVSRELVTAEQLKALESLESLRRGQTTAKESVPRSPVNLDDVRSTAAHLSPTLKAMVRVQAATGMRSTEVCTMRPVDLTQEADGTLVYRPQTHKTAHHGKSKAVPIVDDALLAIQPFLNREPTTFCFSPRESRQWYYDQRHKNRKTHPRWGNKPGTNRKSNPKRAPRERYDKDSYRQALQRAAKKAKVPHWFPHQLRHTAATAIRDALGIEHAQSLVGHSRQQMTEHYAKTSLRRAIEAANAAPTLGECNSVNTTISSTS